MLRTPITLAAAALAAALTLSACGTVRIGAAAVTNMRISTATLSAEVSNLNAAYKADKAKVQLQFPASQMPQQVLSWLLRFRVRDQMAERYSLTVTRGAGPGGAGLRGGAGQAERGHPDRARGGQRGAAGPAARAGPVRGDPERGAGPDGRRDAADRLRGAAVALGNEFNKSQCRAAKSLNIQINPQFGQLDYSQISVVAAPPKLAAGCRYRSPSPPSATAAPQLVPHC